MLDQLEMFTDRPVKDEQVKAFETMLAAQPDWLTAAQVSARVGGVWNDRVIRALAEASNQVISGQRGYRHIRHATAEESRHFVNAMRSQAEKMIDRAERVRRQCHAMVG